MEKGQKDIPNNNIESENINILMEVSGSEYFYNYFLHWSIDKDSNLIHLKLKEPMMEQLKSKRFYLLKII